MHIGDLGKFYTGHEVGFKPGQVGKLFTMNVLDSIKSGSYKLLLHWQQAE